MHEASDEGRPYEFEAYAPLPGDGDIPIHVPPEATAITAEEVSDEPVEPSAAKHIELDITASYDSDEFEEDLPAENDPPRRLAIPAVGQTASHGEQQPDRPGPERHDAPPPSDVATSKETPDGKVPLRSPDWPSYRKEYRLFGPDEKPLDPTDYPDYVARRKDIRFPGESPMTSDERAIVAKVHQAAVQVGDRLGVDVRPRIPNENRYHFFSEKVDYLTAKAAHYGEFTENEGMNNSETGTLLVRQADPVAFNYILAHELLGHELAMELVHVYESTGDLILNGEVAPPISINTGYTRVSRGMNEAVADMLAKEVMDVLGFSLNSLSYNDHDQLLDAAVRETARRRGEPPQAIADPIMRGALTGEYGFQTMRLTLGHDSMNALQQLSGYETRIGVGQAAAEAGLWPEFFNAHQRKLFNWRP